MLNLMWANIKSNSLIIIFLKLKYIKKIVKKLVDSKGCSHQLKR